MPTKRNASKTADAGTIQANDSDILKTTAEAIGSALGTFVAKAGLVSSEPVTSAATRKAGKLQKKNKNRLPRKIKKGQSKQRTGRAV